MEEKEEIMVAEPEVTPVVEEAAVEPRESEITETQILDESRISVESEEPEESGGSEDSEKSDKEEMNPKEEESESPDESESTEEADGAEDQAANEIKRMIDEMGAERLLDIIRDNRNAAIRQIISEVETSRERDMPSGKSTSMTCRSIFDLAAMA